MNNYSVFFPGDFLTPHEFECESFEDLCVGLESAEYYVSKSACPGIKLATFTGQRSNANIEGFTGIELDYDSGLMRPEEVSVILSHHNIKHFIYTTPSHQPFIPRFRVLVPFSGLSTLDERNEDMNKLAHILNNSFAPESRTLSQFYYYGRVSGVLYETFYGAGDFIDQVDIDVPVVAPKTLTVDSVDTNLTAEQVKDLRTALTFLPADDRVDWISVGQNLKQCGDVGFQIWDEWSRRSSKYNERDSIRRWDSFSGDSSDYRSVFTKAQAAGWSNGGRPAVDLKTIDWGIDKPKGARDITAMVANAELESFEKGLNEEVYVIDEIALRGDLTTIYAASNSGKTLLTLHALIETVKSGRIEGKDIFYVNADDNLRRYVEKMKLLIPYDIQCLMPGYKGFEIDEFIPIMKEMQEAGTLKGKIIVLDTLTKFVNLMEKNKSRDFVQALRQFTAHGLTVIMLAHTNKTRGLDGKPIPEGTGDMKNNVDAVYVMDAVRSDDSDIVSVTFNCQKSRGSNAEIVKYRFEKRKDSTYQDLLDSVVKIDNTIGDVEHKHKSSEYSKFDERQVMEHIRANAGGLTLKEINKYGLDIGMKNARQIVDDNMYRLVQIGETIKINEDVWNE